MNTQTGIKKLDDIELKDFTWWVSSVWYDWITNQARVEVHAKETHHVVSRTLKFDTVSDWGSADAEQAVKDYFNGQG